MITIFRILAMTVLHPLTYGLITTQTTSGILLVGCGKRQDIAEMQELITQKHLEHLNSM